MSKNESIKKECNRNTFIKIINGVNYMDNIFACDACHYLFEAIERPGQCPDCGKYKVRTANQEEIDEYIKRKEEVYDE